MSMRLRRFLLMLVRRLRHLPINLHPALPAPNLKAVLLRCRPATAVVAATGVDDLLELVVEEGVERGGEGDGFELALCEDGGKGQSALGRRGRGDEGEGRGRRRGRGRR
jgi:hypothetical protein